jgi:hypothetical protein
MMAADHHDVDMTGLMGPGIWSRFAASLLALVLIASSLTIITATDAAAVSPVLSSNLSQGDLDHCGPAPSKKQKGCTIHCLSWHVSAAPAVVPGPKSLRPSGDGPSSSIILIAAAQPIFDPAACSKRSRPDGALSNLNGDRLFARTQRLRL